VVRYKVDDGRSLPVTTVVVLGNIWSASFLVHAIAEALAAVVGAVLSLSRQGVIFSAGLPALVPVHRWRERRRADG
jgi:hypothetical protein